jgi:non-specific protein-tyrosine kinase
MELKEYLLIIRRWWWLLLACVTIAVIAAYIGVQKEPRIYAATTTVMIGQSLQKPNPSSQEIYISQQLAQTYAELARRQLILEAVRDALSLSYTPSPSSVSTHQVPGTQLLEINVRDVVPERARAIADEVARQLILQGPQGGENQSRRALIQEQVAGLEENIVGTQEEIDRAQEELEAASDARAIQQHQENLAALEDKLSVYQANYASLLSTIQGGINYVSIIEPASTPVHPISPNVGQTLLLAALTGLVVSGGGIFLIELLDDSLRTLEEVQRLTDLPVLGTTAEFGDAGYEDKLIAQRLPLSPITESYRVLRTNVQFAGLDKPLETLLVTSPGPSEGKTVTLANLAIVLAQSGERVVVVDTDLRRPTLHKLFDLPNEAGLTDAILADDKPVTGFLQQTAEIKNLWVLTSGAIPPNPAETLASEQMNRVIQALREHADVILFDSPPALIVADAVILGAKVSGVLIVNDLGRTRRKMAQKVVEVLKRGRVNTLGLVLNRVPKANGYGYYYSHYYGKDGNRHAADRAWWQRLFGSRNGTDAGAPEKESDDEGLRRSTPPPETVSTDLPQEDPVA